MCRLAVQVAAKEQELAAELDQEQVVAAELDQEQVAVQGKDP
jgi:hypothetical protein